MRLKYNFIFIAGILFFTLASLMGGWSLYHLRQGIHLRDSSYIIQGHLDDVLETLQEADIAFLTYKDRSKREDILKFWDLIHRAKTLSERLAAAEISPPKVHKAMQDLAGMVRRKVEIEKKFVADMDFGAGLSTRKVITVNDNIFLTDSFKKLHGQIDEFLVANIGRHQNYVDEYFGISCLFIGIACLFALFCLCVFAWLVSNEIKVRSQLENDLRKAQDAAISASNMKSQFLATVSHEIRTPLNGIIGLAEILQDKLRDIELKRFAGLIYGSSQGLLRIVNDLLDFSKIEADRMSLEIQESQLSPVIENAIDLFAQKAKEKNLTLVADYDANFGDWYAADSARLSQVLHNLLGNAIKFTDRGQITVTGKISRLSTTDAMTASRLVEIEVSDTGCGIRPENFDSVFEPFSQTDSARGKPGTGLGLVISKKLMTMMGGDVDFHSEYGRGSRFWLQLRLRHIRSDIQSRPLLRKESRHIYVCGLASALHAPMKNILNSLGRKQNLLFLNDWPVEIEPHDCIFVSADRKTKVPPTINTSQVIILPSILTPQKLIQALERNASPPAALAKTTEEKTPVVTSITTATLAQGPLPEPVILVVEDNPTNQIVIQSQLEALGFRSHVASNGQECLDAIERYSYAVILMDCRMPVMDGYEATRKIREHEDARQLPRTPIIAMTANAIGGERERCLAAGMDDYTTKPLDLAKINAVIRQHLTERMQSIDWIVIRELERKTDATVINKLLKSYVMSLTDGLQKFNQLTESKSWKEISSLAHHLKSSSATIGAMEFANTLGFVEDQINSKGQASLQDLSDLNVRGLAVLSAIHSQTVYKELT